MTPKEQLFEKIGGTQVYDLWRFLIQKGWQPEFSHFKDTSYFQVYSGNYWHTFNDPTMPENEDELRYNMCAPLDNQDAFVYEKLLELVEKIV